MGVIGLRLHLRDSNNSGNGRDIGNRGRPCDIVGVVRPPPVPVRPVVAVKAMMPWAIPAIGISMGMAIIRAMLKRWIGLGGQGAQGQDKTYRQDNAQPSSQVHWLFLRKKFCNLDLLIGKLSAGKC